MKSTFCDLIQCWTLRKKVVTGHEVMEDTNCSNLNPNVDFNKLHYKALCRTQNTYLMVERKL